MIVYFPKFHPIWEHSIGVIRIHGPYRSKILKHLIHGYEVYFEGLEFLVGGYGEEV